MQSSKSNLLLITYNNDTIKEANELKILKLKHMQFATLPFFIPSPFTSLQITRQ